MDIFTIILAIAWFCVGYVVGDMAGSKRAFNRFKALIDEVFAEISKFNKKED